MILADTMPADATVTPGLEGFLTFFALAVIVVLLVLNMSKHLRRIDARAAQQEAEESAARAAAQEGVDAENPEAADAAGPDRPSPAEPGAPPETGERDR